MPRSQVIKNLLALALIATLGACAKQPATSEVEQQGFIHCEEPRPSMCTREYRPVCGHIDTQIRCVNTPCPSTTHKTYGNACSACGDERVIGYELGSCESFGKGQQQK